MLVYQRIMPFDEKQCPQTTLFGESFGLGHNDPLIYQPAEGVYIPNIPQAEKSAGRDGEKLLLLA